MVVAENYLPCRWVISLDYPSIDLIQNAFTGLRAQKLRVFLSDFTPDEQRNLKLRLDEVFKFTELVEEGPDESSLR
jgi:hypothetical protein